MSLCVKKKFTNLIFSGSGIRGVMYVGALYMLRKLNLVGEIKGYAGSSFGALVAVLLSIGYTIDELYVILSKFDYSKLTDIKIMSMFSTLGLDSGIRIKQFLIKLIKKKNLPSRITFDALYAENGINLIVVTTCISTRSTCYMTHKNYGNVRIIDALCASMCIPWLYCPVSINGQLYVDGGLTDNFPVLVFDDIENTLALEIRSPDNLEFVTYDPFSYTSALLDTIFKNNRETRCRGYSGKIITLITSIDVGEFLLSKQQKLHLIKTGMTITKNEFTSQNA